jgi:hypothetical protein
VLDRRGTGHRSSRILSGSIDALQHRTALSTKVSMVSIDEYVLPTFYKLSVAGSCHFFPCKSTILTYTHHTHFSPPWLNYSEAPFHSALGRTDVDEALVPYHAALYGAKSKPDCLEIEAFAIVLGIVRSKRIA